MLSFLYFCSGFVCPVHHAFCYTSKRSNVLTFLFRFKTVLKSRQILTRVSVCSFRINMSSSSAAPLCRTAQTVPWRLPCVASAGCHWFRIACTLCKSSLLNLFFFAACLLLLNVMINGGYFNDKKTMMLITIIITDFKDSGTGKDR